MLVHRIEDGNGLGPFQNPVARDAIDGDHYNEDVVNFPTPDNDPGFDVSEIYRVMDEVGDGLWAIGCVSREQLQHWFDSAACVALARLGFHYTVFEVPEHFVRAGKFQVAFDHKTAKCLESHPAVALWASNSERIAA